MAHAYHGMFSRHQDITVPGKVSVIIDGQLGSTGKGLAASYVACTEHVDLALSNSSPNAGHSFDVGDGKQVTRHLPICGVIQDRATIYLTAGSIIDPSILLDEIERFQVHNQVLIDPRAAVITADDIVNEEDLTAISSTRKGVGQALARKVTRRAKLAADIPELARYVYDLDVAALLDVGITAVMETSQGFSLSINSGLAYPHCTSREITVTQALSDAQVHPYYLGNVLMTIRTFPIRVGGPSGPFYSDSKELTWAELGYEPELTTVTGKQRRIATFSCIEYKRAIQQIRPTHVLLNFANYMDEIELGGLLDQLDNYQQVSFLGFGPTVADVVALGEGLGVGAGGR